METTNYDEFSPLVGICLASYRIANGISLEDIVERSGLESSYICEVERGQRTPTVAILIQWCRALRITPSDLLQQIEQQKSLLSKDKSVGT